MDIMNKKETEKINVFDIETTGLTSYDEIICFTYGGIQVVQNDEITEYDLLMELSTVVNDLDKHLLVTFNGESKSFGMPGFDIPLLRTRYLINNLSDEYPFRGFKHLDILDVLRKYFNTKHLKPPQLDHLNATQVTELVNLCGLFPLKTKAQNIKQLSSDRLTDDVKATIKGFVLEHTEPKFSEGNSLDSAFSLLCPNASDELLHEEYSGADMPMLFKLFQSTKNEEYLEHILKHNLCCGIKTRMLYDKLIESKLVSLFGIQLTRL